MNNHMNLWQANYLTTLGLMTPEADKFIKAWHIGYNAGKSETIGRETSNPEHAIRYSGDMVIWKSKTLHRIEDGKIKESSPVVCVGQRADGSKYVVMIDYGYHWEILDVEYCFCQAVDLLD